MGRNKSLSKEQVLSAINQWILSHGVPPTIEELRVALGVGAQRTVLRYLSWLEEGGEIQRWAGARGLKVLKSATSGTKTLPIPVVGEVPAGPLMLAEENVEGWLRLPENLLKPTGQRFFLLRVRGDSMNQAKVEGGLIESGDLVLVRQQVTAESGDIVVALIDGEATVKRLVKGSGYLALKPESSNPDHHPIVLMEGCSVLGVVCRVIKRGSELLNLINE